MLLINLLEDWTPQCREPATAGEIIAVFFITLAAAALITGLIFILFNWLVYLLEQNV